jgi:Ca2+-binding EF-hand superfamily protein
MTTIEQLLQEFDNADGNGDGTIAFNTFARLYNKIGGQENKSTEDIKFIFDGIDVDSNGSVSKDEWEALVTALVNGDQTYIHKFLFRAIDKDRSRELDPAEVIKLNGMLEKPLTKEEVDKAVADYGTNGKLNYAQFVKLVSGKEIDNATDPYDGKIPKKEEKKAEAPPPKAEEKKGSCCNLL